MRRLLVTSTSSSKRLRPKIPSTPKADLAPSSIVSSRTATRRPKIRSLPKLPLVLRLQAPVPSSAQLVPTRSTAPPPPSLLTHDYLNDHQESSRMKTDST